MKRICYVVFFLLVLGQGKVVYGAGLLTGVTRLSCEALLCLSSPARPGACNAALSYYFAIKKFTWPATFAARLRFPEQVSDGFSGSGPGSGKRGAPEVGGDAGDSSEDASGLSPDRPGRRRGQTFRGQTFRGQTFQGQTFQGQTLGLSPADI